LLLTIVHKLLFFSILSIEIYFTLLLSVLHICILCPLYGEITRLDPSPYFSNAVEQVALVNKTLSEIRPGKEL
jgi:hypothetical protein